MKTNPYLLVLLLILTAGSARVAAQGSAFTYQGRLVEAGQPANGTYDLQFTLYDAAGGGHVISAPLTNSSTAVSNGLFTVTLDFGANAFPGADRWLQIGVRTNGGGAFVLLSALQKVTASPYAITAGNMTGTLGSGQLAGTYTNTVTFNNPADSFNGAFAGNGGGLTNVNAATLQGLGAAGFWKIAGNSGTSAGANFLGTLDNQALELHVNNLLALRLSPTRSNDTVNVQAGSDLNYIAPGLIASTIAGGGTPNWAGTPETNSIGSDFDTIGGGAGNKIGTNSVSGTISGGFGHRIGDNSFDGAIGGGSFHMIGTNSYYGTVGGGQLNSIQDNNTAATIGGGRNNTVQTNSSFSTISGGYANTISASTNFGGNGVTIGGGEYNASSANLSTIGGGYQNLNTGFYGTIAGGYLNMSGAGAVVIAGGDLNTNLGFAGVIGGGYANTVTNYYGTVSGGYENTNGGYFATIGGGASSSANGFAATIPGGAGNVAAGEYSFAAGQSAQALHNGTFVWADSQFGSFSSSGANQFLVRAGGGVGINTNNPAGAALNVNGPLIATTFNGSFTGNGSGLNLVNAATLNGVSAASFWNISGNSGTSSAANFLGTLDYQPLELHVNGTRALRLEPFSDSSHLNIVNVIGGSSVNYVGPGVSGATVGGGGAGYYYGASYTNSVSGDFGTVGGGAANASSAYSATVAGGQQNVSGGYAATVAGGSGNSSSTTYSTTGGGQNNTNNAYAGTIAGGYANNSSGNYPAIGGGILNSSSGDYSTVAGGYQNATTAPSATVGGGSGNLSRGATATVGGGGNNVASGNNSTIAGGSSNFATNWNGTIGGGSQNTNDGFGATIGGGEYNTASGGDAAVGGGANNVATGNDSTIAGGIGNLATNLYGAIGGGFQNTNNGYEATIAGGAYNTASGSAATIPGGSVNTASGNYSFAAGSHAQALHQGAFVWADSAGVPFSSTTADQFAIRASGGAVISGSANFNNAQLQLVQTANDFSRLRFINPATNWDIAAGTDGSLRFYSGVDRMILTAGGLTVNGTFVSTSDRDSKENFSAVNPQEILEKVAALPITEWNYKTDVGTRHIGPMAQDFYSAFSVGPDEKHIATVDEGGIALAAIQGLNRKQSEETAVLRVREAEIEELKAQNQALAKRLAALERVVASLAGKTP